MLQRYHLLNFWLLILFSGYYCDSNAQQVSKSYCDSLIDTAIQASEKNQHARALELLFEARALAKANDWHDKEFLAANQIGNNYRILSENGEAFNYYLEAHRIATRELSDDEEIRVLHNIGVLYLSENKYDLAISYFKNAYNNEKKNKNFEDAGISAMNLGTAAVAVKDFDLARAYYKEAESLLSHDRRQMLLVKGGLANCDLLEGKTHEARASAEYLLANYTNLDYGNADIELNLIIAKSYLLENKLDMASAYVKKIFGKNPNLDTKIRLYSLLSDINAKKKNYETALAFKDSVFESTAKLNAIKKEQLYENSKIKFELQNYKNKSELNEAKLASERRILYYLIAFIAIITLLAVWIVWNILHKLKQKKLIAERNEKILALELEKEKNEMLLMEKQFNEVQAMSLLQQEKLKNEVEIKNRKLSAKALYLSGKNEMIEEILARLSTLPQVSHDAALATHINSLKNQLKSDHEWDDFVKHFEDVNQGFLNALQAKHPELSLNDIRYISYIYMGLSTKEIASLLRITQDSCRKRKERVLAKMGLSKETNLYEYLTSL